jgi:GH18 family chitinase
LPLSNNKSLSVNNLKQKQMKLTKLITVFFYLLFLFNGITAQTCKEVVGYYPNWKKYSRSNLVNPNTIMYSKYTILNYCFYKPNADGTISSTDTWADDQILLGPTNWSTTPVSRYPGLITLAHQNNVKVLISVGGYASPPYDFSGIAADAVKRSKFAHSCVTMVDTLKLDGIDIDWEFPGDNGIAADKANCTLLFKQVRDSLTTYGTKKGKTFLLTAAVGASPGNMASIDWPNFAPLVDVITLFGYDMYGPWSSNTNHNAPLYRPQQSDAVYNDSAAVQGLIKTYNVPKNKLCLGVPFYGRSVKTVNAPGLHVPIDAGQVDNTTFQEDAGNPVYYNVLLKKSLFSEQWDSRAQVPYLLGLNGLKTFVSYDNKRSIGLKAKYIMDNNLRGATIWEITGDYIETSPGSGIIAGTPLLDTLNLVLCNNVTTGISNNGTENDMKLFPNPSAGNAVLVFTLENASSVVIEIYNSLGQLISSNNIAGQQGLNRQSIEIATPGFYSVVVKNNQQIIKAVLVVN